LATPPRNQIFARFVAGCSSLLLPIVLTHTVFDIVVDDKVEFLVSEAVVLCKGSIYFVNNGLGEFGDYALDSKRIMRKLHVPFDRVSRKIRHESLAEQHQMALHLVFGKTDKVDREGVNLAFVDMTTVRENSDKPVEKTRIQAAQRELCIGFIG